MHKVWIIIQREYMTRVTKRSFLITTFIVPILFGVATYAMIMISTKANENLKIAVMDYTGIFRTTINEMNSGQELAFDYLETPIPKLADFKKQYEEKGYDAILYIPNEITLDNPEGISYISSQQPGIVTEDFITDHLSQGLKEYFLHKEGIDTSLVRKLENQVSLKKDIGDGTKQGSTGLATGIGYFCGFLIYLYLLLFGAMVMRGVAEEKTNRIIEVIISSVKPFQLMLGKILGIGLVGLTQFTIWIVCSFGINIFIGILFKEQLADLQNIPQPGAMGAASSPSSQQILLGFATGFQNVNIIRLVFSFLFYFIFGYIFYASQFAAIGAAVTDDGDTQSMTFPVTIPIIISIFLMSMTLTQPESNLAIWSSMIPFSSPIVMMSRIPFEISWGQQILSMLILAVSSIGMVWIAGRIYRVGILIQGKKVTFKELGKWMFYKV